MCTDPQFFALYILFLVIAYLFGSVPFGLVLTKLSGLGDIRKMGSGNIGATNVLRTGNKFLALTTFLCDAGKGGVAILLFGYLPDLSNNSEIIPCSDTEKNLLSFGIAIAAIIGHMFPIWLKFKGGKGVATTIGCLLALKPLMALVVCGIWLICAVTTRISSLSALIATAAVPIIVYAAYDSSLDITLTALCISLLVWIKHHENIHRLLKGEEPKIGKKK